MTPSRIPYTVTSIVGRCHVGQTDRQVIRYFISRLKRGYKTWATFSRDGRREWMQWVIAAHHKNQQLYRDVMGGGR